MKKCLLVLFIFTSNFITLAQTISSSCTITDSIKSKYQNDADRLAIRKFFNYNLSYKDSAKIPQIHSDTILTALATLYNAINFPTRDTIIDILNIHSLGDYGLRGISIAIDSNTTWLVPLKTGILPCGNTQIDSLINTFHFSFINYSNLSNQLPFHIVNFISDSNYNIQAIANTFNAIQGVAYADKGLTTNNGFNIEDSILNDHVQLKFTYGWEDCQLGCLYWHYWKLKIYYDCKVEIVGSYGNQLNIVGINVPIVDNFIISPNPTQNRIHITSKNNDPIINYKLYNTIGNLLKYESLTNNTIDISNQPIGIYFIQLQTEKTIQTVKIIKQ